MINRKKRLMSRNKRLINRYKRLTKCTRCLHPSPTLLPVKTIWGTERLADPQVFLVQRYNILRSFPIVNDKRNGGNACFSLIELRSSSDATRQNPSELGSALTAPSVLTGRRGSVLCAPAWCRYTYVQRVRCTSRSSRAASSGLSCGRCP